MSLEHCGNDTCNEHRWEKVDAGYYPRQRGENGTLSKNHRRGQSKRKAVRRQVGWVGSEKTIPDSEALQGKISDLGSQLHGAAQIIVATDKTSHDLTRKRKNSNKPTIEQNRECTRSGVCCGKKKSSILGPMQAGKAS